MSHSNVSHGARSTSRTGAPPRSGWTARLYDGTPVVIRPIDRQDADLELEFLNHLSPEMRHLRFLGLVREPCPEVARELTDLDPSVAAGFIAVVSDEGREREIGAAHFHADPTGKRCDCSVTVSDQWQKRGVGSLLMHQLIEAARTRGMRHMRAFAPAQSGGSRQLAGRLGFQRRLDPHDPGAVVYDLELE